ARRAVHGRDDGHVVPRADAAVLALEAVERAHVLARVECDRLDVDADVVAIGGQLPDVQVVAVDMVADGDVPGGEADDLAVAPNGLAGRDRTAGHLVPGLDVDADGDAGQPVFEDRAGGELLLGDGDVVLRLQYDRAVGEWIGGHGVPHYTPGAPGGDFSRTTTAGARSSWIVVWSIPKRAWSTACSSSRSRSLSDGSATTT